MLKLGGGKIQEKDIPEKKIIEGEELKKLLLDGKTKIKVQEPTHKQKDEMIKSYEKTVLEPQKKLAESYAKIMKITPNKELKDKLEFISEPVSYDVFSKIKNTKSPLVKIEENNWERHNEQIDVQEKNLTILEEILKQQKSTSRMTKIIIFLTFMSIFIALIAAQSELHEIYEVFNSYIFQIRL